MNPDTVAGVGDPGHPARWLQTVILRSVSRSFYLSIRFLPAQLREPIALAYLLARASDTVADTSQIPVTVRMETLRLLSGGIQGTASGDVVAELTASFISLQENASERQLLEALPDCLFWLNHMDHGDRNEIHIVLEQITRGQMLDLERFGDPKEVRALGTAADLDEYAYLVAGCVGEFWTRLCFRHVRKFTSRSDDEMLALGKRYGMALQLINVLRDAGSDLRAGRCYFPEYELNAVDLTPSQILAAPERFQSVYRTWRQKAKRGLQSGMEYSRAIENCRVRAATVLPALIGARTLALLDASGPAALQRNVKVPRREVRAMIVRLALACGSRHQIESIWNSATAYQYGAVHYRK